MSARIYESLIVAMIGNAQARVWRTTDDPDNCDMSDLIAQCAEWHDKHQFDPDFKLCLKEMVDALADFPNVSAVEIRIGSNAVLAYNDWP